MVPFQSSMDEHPAVTHGPTKDGLFWPGVFVVSNIFARSDPPGTRVLPSLAVAVAPSRSHTALYCLP